MPVMSFMAVDNKMWMWIGLFPYQIFMKFGNLIYSMSRDMRACALVHTYTDLFIYLFT